MDGNISIGTSTLNAGNASLGISTLTAGSHSITASYGGSSAYLGSISPALLQVVVLPNSGTTTSLVANVDPITVGSPVILTSTVSSSSAAQSLPTGTVTFLDGATVLGKSNLNAGVATVTVSTLSAGTHLLTAVYDGDQNYVTSTSAVLTEIVLAGSPASTPFTFTVNPAVVSLRTGSHVTLQIDVPSSNSVADTLSFGCGGLPTSATCTFSKTQLAIAPGSGSSLNVVLDTGDPLGTGPLASELPNAGTNSLHTSRSAGLLIALGFPSFTLFSLGWRSKRRFRSCLLSVLCLVALLASGGCGSSYQVHSTPAGKYTIQIFATGSGSGGSFTVPVQLTVTQ